MTIQDVKDMAKDIVVHVIEIALGVFVAMLAVEQTAPVKLPPAQVTVVIEQDTNLVKALEHMTATNAALFEQYIQESKDFREQQAEISEKRFGAYLNN